jgi:uncharacterized protein YjiS (DUF1127 family)
MDITLDLAPGAVLHLPRGHRLHLRLTRGRLWLTRHDDADDHFIIPGAPVDVDGSDQVVVESDGPGAATLHVVVLGRSPAALWRGWRQLWRRWTGPRWPAELQGLDAHLLRDIGAHPALRMRAQALTESRRITAVRAHQLGLT